MITEVYLGLGSNLGDRRGRIADGLTSLREAFLELTASRLYETSPVGFAVQPRFLNAACRILTRLDPFELLARVRSIEAAANRQRPVPNGPRSLDIDILVYGRIVLNMPGLQVPHPRMAEREFVLRPLNEIAPDLEHPVLGETVASLLAGLTCRKIVGDRNVEKAYVLRDGGRRLGIESSMG